PRQPAPPPPPGPPPPPRRAPPPRGHPPPAPRRRHPATITPRSPPVAPAPALAARRIRRHREHVVREEVGDVVDDVLHRHHADRLARLADQRHVAEAAHAHLVERVDDRIVGREHLGVRRHEIAHRALPVALPQLHDEV